MQQRVKGGCGFTVAYEVKGALEVHIQNNQRGQAWAGISVSAALAARLGLGPRLGM